MIRGRDGEGHKHPHLLFVIVPRHDFRDEFRGAADRVQHVPEVMADDAQKFISRGKLAVAADVGDPTPQARGRPSALSCQVRVGVVPFSGEQSNVVGTFLAKGLVRSGSLFVNDLILLRPLAHKNLGRRRRGHMRRQSPIVLARAAARTSSARDRARLMTASTVSSIAVSSSPRA